MDTDDEMEPRNDITRRRVPLTTDGNSRKKTRMDGIDDTKGFKHRLDVNIMGHFNWQVTHKHRTEWLVSCGNWYRDVTKEERRSLKEFIPVV